MSEQEVTSSLWDEFTSPVNLILVFFILYLLYKIVKSHFETIEPAAPAPPPMPKLHRDMTVAELRKYDGSDPEGRVLIALNNIIFDVTRGKRFYGPGGPYSAFAGRDATRGLATQQVAGSEVEYDDVSDLSPDELAAAKEWEEQFKEKYDIVGRLLKPGEIPNKSNDDDSEEKKTQ